MVFAYRQGLDEATILRMLIHVAALQFMKIDVTQELITAKLQSYSRLDALYSFISEVNYNADALKTWSKLDKVEKKDNYYFLIHRGVPALSSSASATLINLYFDNPLESGLKQMTIQYLDKVEQINSTIYNFNKENSPSNDNVSQNERWQTIKSFLDNQTLTPYYDEVLNWPTKTSMTNLWLVIRDPCYS